MTKNHSGNKATFIFPAGRQQLLSIEFKITHITVLNLDHHALNIIFRFQNGCKLGLFIETFDFTYPYQKKVALCEIIWPSLIAAAKRDYSFWKPNVKLGDGFKMCFSIITESQHFDKSKAYVDKSATVPELKTGIQRVLAEIDDRRVC